MIRVGLIDDDLEHQKMICEFINTYKNEKIQILRLYSIQMV